MASLNPNVKQPGPSDSGIPMMTGATLANMAAPPLANPAAIANTATLGNPATPGYTPFTAPQATNTAPTPTPFGNFTGPNPADVANDPYYQFRLAEGEKGIQRSAAAKGTLLSGGTLKSLARFDQGLASEEGSKAYDRAMSSYMANRGTNAQNYGQQMDAYGATTSANNASGRLALDTASFNANQQQDEYQRQLDDYQRQVEATRRQNEEASAQQIESTRRQNEATSAFARLPVAKTSSPWQGAAFR